MLSPEAEGVASAKRSTYRLRTCDRLLERERGLEPSPPPNVPVGGAAPAAPAMGMGAVGGAETGGPVGGGGRGSSAAPLASDPAFLSTHALSFSS